jgi:hypothetical protein
LSVGELTRRRTCDIARAFVSHRDRIYVIKMGRKFKALGRSPCDAPSDSARTHKSSPSTAGALRRP